MHELALCQALVKQVQQIAGERGAGRVLSVTLSIGPLSGVEAELLKQAYPIATAGTVAEASRLEIEATPVKVRCSECGEISSASPNNLLCGACGGWRTVLESGDEMLLVSLELEICKETNHV